jgi:hypothetical protein
VQIVEKTGVVVLEGPEAKALLRFAEAAHLPGHVREIEARVEQLAGAPLEWRPVGGEGRVIHSALGAAGESTHLIGEPIMNFFDAAFEMAFLLALKSGDAFEPSSIYEAAARWYGVPAEGLASWERSNGVALAEFQALARRSQLIIQSGSRADMPTVVFLDNWLGQHPADHPETILSIQKGLKAERPFLAGQYGHGAGFTFAFSEGGQVLLSRRCPDLLRDGQEDLVGLSLVVRKMPSETSSPSPTYWYAVASGTESPIAFRPAGLKDPRWHGLRRICIDYEMRRANERSIWEALEHNISRPPLPYTLRDERESGNKVPQSHFLAGNEARLQRRYVGEAFRAEKNPIRVPHRRTTKIDLDAWIGDDTSYGSVDVTTTFVKQEGTSKGNDLYAPVKESEIWTLNGQRHHARSRLHFGQKPIQLDAIRDNLLVDIKLDGLTADGKALILTTDRQGAAERGPRFALEQAVDDLLATDVELRRLNKEAHDDALQAAATSSRKDLDRELTQFQHFVRTEKVKVRVRVKKQAPAETPPTPKVKLEPIYPLLTHPTFLRFRKKFRQVVRIAPGHTASVLLEADAVDGYFGSHRQPMFAFNPGAGSALRVVSLDELKDGRTRVRIKAGANAQFGTLRLIASYLPPSAAGPLTTEIDVEIAARKPRVNSGKGKQREVEAWEEREEERPAPPRYAVLFAAKEPSWASCNMGDWTDRTVGEYRTGVAYVNGDYRPVKRLLAQVATEKHEEFLSLYLAPVIMTLVGLAKQESEPPKDEDTGEAVPLHDSYRRAALEGVALSSIFTIRKLRRLGFDAGDDE